MENKMNIDGYLARAEANFSNAIGSEELDLGYGFYGDNGNLIEPYSGAYGQMQGAIMPNYQAPQYYGVDAGQAVIAPSRAIPAKQPTPYQVNVTNTTAGTLTVTLFGLNTYLLTPNFGTSVGVTVTPAQSNVSYLELLQQSASQPFETSLIRIQTSNPSQITQILTLTSKDANGQLCQIPIITQSYFSANQFQSTILDVPYPVKIDGSTYLTFPILGNTTATYTFFPSEKVNVARNLGGGNQQQVYSAPAVPVAVPMFAASKVGARPRLMIDPANR
jgi:hypothetical protein